MALTTRALFKAVFLRIGNHSSTESILEEETNKDDNPIIESTAQSYQSYLAAIKDGGIWLSWLDVLVLSTQESFEFLLFMIKMSRKNEKIELGRI